MVALIFRCWLWLLYFEYLMSVRGFGRVVTAVRSQRTCSAHVRNLGDATLCHAMDLACVFYFKRVLCLQRSAATVVLLRRCGWNAELVIGAQLLPFQSHAWVEIQNRIVNDKPYVHEMFQVLERC